MKAKHDTHTHAHKLKLPQLGCVHIHVIVFVVVNLFLHEKGKSNGDKWSRTFSPLTSGSPPQRGKGEGE